MPRGWVIDARHFTRDVEASLPRGHDLATLIKLAHTKAGVDRAARARDRILAHGAARGSRARARRALGGHGARRALGASPRARARRARTARRPRSPGSRPRCSACAGPPALADAIRKVWASAFLPRALAYLAHAGVRDLAMAVVLQIMVQRRGGGRALHRAAAGARGRALAAGRAARQRHARPRARRWSRARPRRTRCGCRARRGGARGHRRWPTSVAPWWWAPPGSRRWPSPRRARARRRSRPRRSRALAELADRLEERVARALRQGRCRSTSSSRSRRTRRRRQATPTLWLLQVRPITGGGFPEGGDADTVWSRTNVGEALPGPATPLTWSIARAFSDKGFHEAFSALGCRVPRGASLVGNVQGRFYLNLTRLHADRGAGAGPRRRGRSSPPAAAPATRSSRRWSGRSADVSRRGFLLRLPFTAPRAARAAGAPRARGRGVRGRDRPRPARPARHGPRPLARRRPRHHAPRRRRRCSTGPAP